MAACPLIQDGGINVGRVYWFTTRKNIPVDQIGQRIAAVATNCWQKVGIDGPKKV